MYDCFTADKGGFDVRTFFSSLIVAYVVDDRFFFINGFLCFGLWLGHLCLGRVQQAGS